MPIRRTIMLKIEQVLRNEKGENVLKDYFESITYRFSYIIVKKNGLYGLYNANNYNKILECEWYKLVFEGDYIIAYKNISTRAAFHKSGKQILKADWNKVSIYPYGIVATRNGLQGFYDFNGVPILECTWRRIEPFGNLLFAYVGNGKKAVRYDLRGNILKE